MKIAEQKKRWFNEQMEHLIVDKQMTKSDIARALGILPQSLNSVVNGARGLSDKFIDEFAETFSINEFVLKMPALGKETQKENAADDLMKVIASQQDTIARLTKVIERLTAEEKKDQNVLTA